MSHNRFDFRRMDFDDMDDYEGEEQIRRTNRKDIPQKHLKKVVKSSDDKIVMEE